MSYVKSLLFCFFAVSCMCSNPNYLSNLIPDGVDRRAEGDISIRIGDTVENLYLYNTDGSTPTSTDILTAKGGLVLYFTMWCSFCDTQINNIEKRIVGKYPDVEIYLVDYVSDTVDETRSNQIMGGYETLNTAFDKNGLLVKLFSATMGTTVVIDRNSVLRMNEDFKDGQRLDDVLSYLP